MAGKKGSGRKVKPEQARQHEVRAWELRQRGWTLLAIAGDVGVTEQAVSQILQRVTRRVLEQLKGDVEAKKVEQDAQLDYIKAEALSAWERSRQPVRTQTTRRANANDGGDVQEQTTQQAVERVGDPAFLDAARAAMADQRAIWGLDAPKRKEVTGKDGGPIQTQALDYDALWRRPAIPDPVEERITQEQAKAGSNGTHKGET